MNCVYVDAAGYVRLVDPQPVDVSGCTMVLVSGNSVMNNPFAMTAEQGAQIGGAIAALWVIAGVFRVVRERI